LTTINGDRSVELSVDRVHGRPLAGGGPSLSDACLNENENRMSKFTVRLQLLGMVVILCLGALLAGCSRYTGDAGADRSRQQSQELRERIRTTQVDR
jgi:hypothetical protein